uniref:Uncharacterized protein n=1 Tax=Phytophthora fragariae TaxID=53985 RepID=A0A6A3EZR6_9STRA|nr:hypothetical protein PF009_g14577 [Phytophthora fragariae]
MRSLSHAFRASSSSLSPQYTVGATCALASTSAAVARVLRFPDLPLLASSPLVGHSSVVVPRPTLPRLAIPSLS